MRDGPGIWEVVRVDFPHADTATLAARPAVVIASPAATDVFRIIWVLMITSSRHTKWPDDVLVTDLAQAGLSRPSVIRTGKIAAIDHRYVSALGQLSEPDRASVRGRLRLHLGPALLI
jgi:mRNA-degrading endonuclease toxin of MazEF toxin-antitoxin module